MPRATLWAALTPGFPVVPSAISRTGGLSTVFLRTHNRQQHATEQPIYPKRMASATAPQRTAQIPASTKATNRHQSALTLSARISRWRDKASLSGTHKLRGPCSSMQKRSKKLLTRDGPSFRTISKPHTGAANSRTG
eukprot:6479345-Amphidinium_carterae.2